MPRVISDFTDPIIYIYYYYTILYHIYNMYYIYICVYMIQSHLTCVNMCQHIFQHISSLSAQVLIVEAVEPREVPHHLKPHVLIERDGLGPSQWTIE